MSVFPKEVFPEEIFPEEVFSKDIFPRCPSEVTQEEKETILKECANASDTSGRV